MLKIVGINGLSVPAEIYGLAHKKITALDFLGRRPSQSAVSYSFTLNPANPITYTYICIIKMGLAPASDIALVTLQRTDPETNTPTNGAITSAYTGDGGFAISGQAASSASRWHVSQGGFAIGGKADVVKINNSRGSGGFVVSGAAQVSRSVHHTASGGFILNGAATFSKGATHTAQGGFVIRGSTQYIRSASYASTGGFALAGSASVVTVTTQSQYISVINDIYGVYGGTMDHGLVFTSAGLPAVLRSSDETICQTLDNAYQIQNKAGTCTLYASHPGNALYYAVAEITLCSIFIDKAQQEPLTLVAPQNIVLSEPVQAIIGGGSGTGTYQFFASPTPDLLTRKDATGEYGSFWNTSGWFKMIKKVTAQLILIKLGDNNYYQADTIIIDIKATQSPVTISINQSNLFLGDSSTGSVGGGSGTGLYMVEAAGGGTANPIVSITTGALPLFIITALGLGSTTIRAKRLGDTNYNDSAWTTSSSISVINVIPITVTFISSNWANYLQFHGGSGQFVVTPYGTISGTAYASRGVGNLEYSATIYSTATCYQDGGYIVVSQAGQPSNALTIMYSDPRWFYAWGVTPKITKCPSQPPVGGGGGGVVTPPPASATWHQLTFLTCPWQIPTVNCLVNQGYLGETYSNCVLYNGLYWAATEPAAGQIMAHDIALSGIRLLILHAYRDISDVSGSHSLIDLNNWLSTNFGGVSIDRISLGYGYGTNDNFIHIGSVWAYY